jgi:XisH protein
MPARDIYHDSVKKALLKDGWQITHDPLRLTWGKKDMYVDLGAERLMAAQKGNERIAVEIKSFVSASSMADLEGAIGQYILYFDVLQQREPDRKLYVAIRQKVYEEVFEEPLGQLLLTNGRLKLIVFDDETDTLLQWIP